MLCEAINSIHNFVCNFVRVFELCDYDCVCVCALLRAESLHASARQLYYYNKYHMRCRAIASVAISSPNALFFVSIELDRLAEVRSTFRYIQHSMFNTPLEFRFTFTRNWRAQCVRARALLHFERCTCTQFRFFFFRLFLEALPAVAGSFLNG